MNNTGADFKTGDSKHANVMWGGGRAIKYNMILIHSLIRSSLFQSHIRIVRSNHSIP